MRFCSFDMQNPRIEACSAGFWSSCFMHGFSEICPHEALQIQLQAFWSRTGSPPGRKCMQESPDPVLGRITLHVILQASVGGFHRILVEKLPVISSHHYKVCTLYAPNKQHMQKTPTQSPRGTWTSHRPLSLGPSMTMPSQPEQKGESTRPSRDYQNHTIYDTKVCTYCIHTVHTVH